METRFPHIPTQESLDRLAELDRRKRRRIESERAVRTFFSVCLILAAQVLLIVAVASQHEAWPF
jgi:hypothetical protein